MAERDEPREVREVRELAESRQDIQRQLAPTVRELREAEHTLLLAIRAAQRRNAEEYRQGLAPKISYARGVALVLKHWHAYEAEERDRQSFRALIEARKPPK